MGHTTFCDHCSQLKRCYFVSEHHSSTSTTAQLNLSPQLFAYGVCLTMRLVHRGTTFNIYHDDLQLTWAISYSSDHRKGLDPSSLGHCPGVLSFQWFALVGLPASNLNYLSCWLQRERAISCLLWIFLNCEFFLPSQL